MGRSSDLRMSLIQFRRAEEFDRLERNDFPALFLLSQFATNHFPAAHNRSVGKQAPDFQIPIELDSPSGIIAFVSERLH